jgi:cation diffusion facilitator CzcD-associated flavoprotein CzcO
VEHAETVIIGAGPAGLACAAALQDEGLPAIVLEKDEHVGSSWRKLYDRLHLHTTKRQSGLPGLPMPRSYSKYPSRDQLVAYQEDYAARNGIAPRFGTRVAHVTRPDNYWLIETPEAGLAARNVIVATGIAGWPHRPEWPGRESFAGQLVHSSEYSTSAPFADARVLVIGFGNSGAEIAMDLADAGAKVSISVRSPANIVPRDMFGVSIVTWAILERSLPYRLVDALNAPLLRLMVGDVEKLGLRRATKGPMAQVVEDHKIPVLDIGTVDYIRRGKISIRGGIDRIVASAVVFDDETTEPYDVIVEATGYLPDLRSLLPDHQSALDPFGGPARCGEASGHPGLYFCGHIPSPTGQLREIGIEARRIASLIKSRANSD